MFWDNTIYKLQHSNTSVKSQTQSAERPTHLFCFTRYESKEQLSSHTRPPPGLDQAAHQVFRLGHLRHHHKNPRTTKHSSKRIRTENCKLTRSPPPPGLDQAAHQVFRLGHLRHLHAARRAGAEPRARRQARGEDEEHERRRDDGACSTLLLTTACL